MIYTLLLTATLLGQSDPVQGPHVAPLPQQPEGLVVRLWIDSTRCRLYDPAFVRVTVTNTLDLAVLADSGAACTEQYTIKAGQFTYAYSTGISCGVAPPLRMNPGDEWIVDYYTLGFPPTDEFDHDFWDGVVKANEVLLSATFQPGQQGTFSPDGVDGTLYSNASAWARLRVSARPDAETEFLESIFAERLRRRREGLSLDRQKWGRPVCYPGPGIFGVNIGVYENEDLIQRLLDFEESLSPGPLRHVVHLTRLMRALRDEQDAAKKTKVVEDLVRFIDTLPQIERENVVWDLYRSGNTVAVAAGDRANFYLLSESLLRRMPKNIWGYEDFPAYARKDRGLDGPEYREYAERLRDIENLIGPAEETKPQPKKGRYSGDDPFK